MPGKEKLEMSLMKKARAKGLKGKDINKYVYGTLTKMGGANFAKKAAKMGDVKAT